MSVNFFGKIDMKKGKRTSNIPAWGMSPQIEELHETIKRKERALKRGEIPRDSVPETRAELEKEKERLFDIMDSKPKVSDIEMDKIHKAEKMLGQAISETMFTRSDMKMGFADAHEEARRMKDDVVKVPKEAMEFMEKNGIKFNDKGYASRDNASMMWKVMRRFKGEPGNVEMLRKDKATARTRS